jgi:hypothetical protein
MGAPCRAGQRLDSGSAVQLSVRGGVLFPEGKVRRKCPEGESAFLRNARRVTRCVISK